MPRFRNMCSAIFKGKKVDDSQSSSARTTVPKPLTDRRAAPTTQLDKPKDEGKVRKGDKLSPDTTTEAKKQNAEPPRFPLDRFWSSTATTHDAKLAEAREKYQESVEKLAGVLRERKDPKFMPDVQAYYASGQAQALEIPEFAAVTNSVQASREQQVQRWYTQVGHGIAGAFPAVKVVLGLTGTIAEYASFAPVKITANGLSTVFDLVTKSHEETGEVVKTLEDVWKDHNDLSELSGYPLSKIPIAVQISATKLQVALVDFIREAIMWLDHNPFAQFFIAGFGYERTADARKALMKSREDLRDSIAADLYFSSKSEQWQKEQKDFLEQELCKNAVFTRHEARQRKYHDERLENTANWLFEEGTDEGRDFERWVSGDASFLWCTGIGGTGKTYLISRIVDHIKDLHALQNVGVACFYNEYEQRVFQNLDDVVRVLCRQLLQSSPSARESVSEKYRKKTIDRETLKQVLKSTVDHFDTVFLIVDALDEYSANVNEQTTLVLHLVDQMIDFKKIKLLISSRPAVDVHKAVEEQFTKAEKNRRQTSPPLTGDTLSAVREQSRIAYLEARASEENLKDMVHWLAHDKYSLVYSQAQNLLGKDPSLEARLLAGILEKSRIFKLANLQAQAVFRAFPIDNANRELKDLQPSIPHYYKKTADLINALESSSRNRVHALLSWVFYSKTPVRKSHFSVALPVGEECERTFDNVTQWLWGDDVSSIVSASEGLVIEQDAYGADDTLVFGHNTVRDFIHDNSFPLSIDLIIDTSIKFLQMSTTDLNELQILHLASPLGHEVRRIGKGDLKAVKSDFPEVTHDFLFQALNWGQYAEDILNEPREMPKMAREFMGHLSQPKWTTVATPLHWCAGNNWARMCEWLLKNDAEPNAQLAGVEDRLDADPVDSGIAPYSVDLPSKCTPLHVAVYYKNAETVKILARQSHVDLNALDSQGYTPLVYAISGCGFDGGYDSLEYLTARKDLKINNQYWFSDPRWMPFAIIGPKDVENYHARYRMALEPKPERSNLRPIHLVALDLDARSMEMLHRHGNLEFTEPTKDGITALMIATWAFYRSYSVAAMQRLLSYPGNKLDIQDSLNRTALMHAIIYNSMDLKPVALLIEAGAKLDLQDEKGHTALMLAIANKNVSQAGDRVELILDNEDKGLNVNAKDKENGRSALMMAACPDRLDTDPILPVDVLHVKRLLKVVDIDPHAVDNDDHSALDLAREQMETDKSLSALFQQDLEEEDLFGIHLANQANNAERARYLRLEHESTQKSESDATTRGRKLNHIENQISQIQRLEERQKWMILRQEIVTLLKNTTTKVEG